MPAVITNKFRIHNAIQFVESLSESSNTVLYFYLGNSTEFVDDLNPPSPGATPANTDIDPWNTMFAAKRILSGDVSHVTKRYEWVSGESYDQYDDKGASGTDILTAQFYVITDQYNVYKCLYNNGGAPSTYKPTGTSENVISTSDGYKWKYMFTVSPSDTLKFLTPSHIPVKTLTSDDGSAQWTVQSTAIAGAVDVVLIESGGSGYVSSPTVSVTGNGTGASFTATINAGTGQVTGLNILNRGSNYTNMTISFSGGGSGGGAPTSSAVARAIIPPRGGHGSDPVRELGGVYIIMNVRLDGNEANTFVTGNDFRQLGIISDPLLYGSGAVATAPVYRQTYKYQLTGVSSEFLKDGVITYGANTAYVVDYQTVGANNYLYTTVSLPSAFQVGNNLTTSTANGTILSIESPGLQPYSGNIMYVENRIPVARATDQIEDIKLIVEF